MSDLLRLVPFVSEVSGSYLKMLHAGARDVELTAGDYLFHEGAPAGEVFFLLEGELEITQRNGEGEEACNRFTVDALPGQMAFLLSSPHAASARAARPSRAIAVPAVAMRRLFNAPAEAEARQAEKLDALSRLAAGLAHELNNPAAAARRAVQQLQSTLQEVYTIGVRLHRYGLTEEQWERLLSAQNELFRHSAQAAEIAPLDLSDREEALSEWFDEHGVVNAWQLAPTLVRAGWDKGHILEIAREFPPEAVADVVAWLCDTQVVVGLQREIDVSTEAIADLVESVKAYTHMDRAPDHDLDLHEGLENTLTILGHRLRRRVVVHREFDPHLPRIQAWGNELNQVWTNLIDNAADATHGHGQLWLRTRRDGDEHVVVEVADDGEGIPPEVQTRIFEPFFTTKKQNKGAGLGLDIAWRIVTERYGGEITLRSSPGDTCFYVRLPIRQPRTNTDNAPTTATATRAVA